MQLNCMGWDFNWHKVYNYADDVSPLLPAGTVLHAILWHDNTKANRANPDPRNWRGYGQRTIDGDGVSRGSRGRTWKSADYKAKVAERSEARRDTAN